LQLYNIREDPYEKQNRAAEHSEIVEKLRGRLAYHRRFARDEETPERIPNFPPAVYGEEENQKYGQSVRGKASALGLKEQDEKAIRKNRRGATPNIDEL
jgi:hypothetical protein